MGRKVYLNKSKHYGKIMANLVEMRNEGDHCDFTIIVGERRFRAHKNILSAGSRYFKAMLKHDTMETRRGEVEMKDMDSECFQSCLDFIYTAEFDISDRKYPELLHASQMLQLDEVRDAVVETLEMSLAIENFFTTRQIAKLFSLECLYQKCKEFEIDNFVAISKIPEFKSLEQSHVIKAMKSPKMMISEEEKLGASIRYVGGRVERKKDLLKFLKYIKLKEISNAFMENLMEKDSIISNDLELYKIFSNALKENFKMSLALLAESGADEDEGKIGECGKEHTLIMFDKDENCLQSFDPVTNEITKFSDTKFCNLGRFSSVSMNSFIYILCQNKSVYKLDSRYRNPKWKKVADMITDHGAFPPSVSLNGCIFVVGSCSSKKTSNIVEQYNPITDQWRRLNDKPSPVMNPAVVSLNEEIYCIGGSDVDGESTLFSKYVLSSSEWVTLPHLRRPKQACGAAAAEQKIFVFGGYRSKNGTLNEVDCYDILTSQWFILSPMIEPLWFVVVHRVGDWVFVAQREPGSKSNALMKYNVRNEQWCMQEFQKTRFKMYDFVYLL